MVLRKRLGEVPLEPVDTGFVGRSRDLLALERLRRQERWAVVRGQGGEGKTALAAELARWLVRFQQVKRAAFVSVELCSHGAPCTRPRAATFAAQQRPDGTPMGKLHYQSRFAATIEEVCALVEDTKTAHPDLSVVVLDHFHAIGASPGYGNQTTAELANRAMALKALAGRCDLDILIVAQLNRGAYGSTTGPDVSHLAGTSELERYASAVWLIDRPKPSDGPPPPPGLLEVHHGKTRHGQIGEADINRTLIRIDRAHCFLEADEARVAFVGHHLYPGVAAL